MKRFEIQAEDEWLARLDNWRCNQRPVLSRAEANRRLVDKALENEPVYSATPNAGKE